jgi:glycosyltransferase involved in cell wall biosynthesis
MKTCEDCPDLSLPFSLLFDSTKFNWRLKKWILQKSNITLIVASSWMQNRVKKSPLLSAKKSYIVPFGIDTTRFRPLDKRECREKLGIPEDAWVLSFRYRGEHDRFKGWKYIEEVLSNLDLPKPTYLIVFEGKSDFIKLKNRYHIVQLGWFEDSDILITALNASDIFLMPSTAEAFGMMAIESMACGTPVIVFEGTSLPDVINAPSCGVSIPYKDTHALADAIINTLNNKEALRTISQNGLEYVKDTYKIDNYIQKHLDIYTELLHR